MANLIIKSSADNLVLQGSDASPAVTVAADGQTTFAENATLSGTANVYGAGTFPAGHVIQVESTTLTTSYTAANSNFTDITGMSVVITPKFSDSKVLVVVSIGITASNDHHARIVRNLPSDPTAIAVGTGQAGSQTAQTFGYIYNATGSFVETRSMNFLDSPATTSAITYKVQAKGTGTLYINRSSTDSNEGHYGRNVSTITVMEVAQ